ncbi:GLPGLI family protein [Croceivirga thetidis]|uniref:GLPGLI family protein n=1 Tax=Croceivirga thetidis TaxID=2721623 RepID=A0ABX1GNI2_9FLAO|nr:GLPGLI family protein [Croceivirga thetidis]NKI30525.1 GLPGLI family protein [Croceivirga thetidis]
MKYLLILLVLPLTLHVVPANAQEFTGFATYKSASKMSITMDSTQISSNEQNLINQRLMQAMQKEYKLTFNKSESNWKEVEKLENDAAGGGVEIVMIGMGGGNDGLLYKNTKDKNFVESTDSFGKLFLISGELEPYEWEMTSETKQIGRYTCYQAIAKRETTQISISDVNGEKEEKEETKIQTITAWYTPEIPVTHGPDDYWGLPGLIMEINNGNRVLVCNKVVLNPKEDVAIEIPSKGKKVTDEEYEVIMKEQVEKMNKMYGGGKRKGNGANIEIKIGG